MIFTFGNSKLKTKIQVIRLYFKDSDRLIYHAFRLKSPKITKVLPPPFTHSIIKCEKNLEKSEIAKTRNAIPHDVIKMNKKLLIQLLLILVALVWAVSFIVVNIATEEIDPIQLGFLRFLIATPLMTLILIIRNKNLIIPLKELPSLAILGLTGVTFLYVFQFIGIDYTNAATAAVLINTHVIFIAVLSAVFLKEQFSFRKSTGIVLSFIGVIGVILATTPFEKITLDNTFFIGSLLMLLSAFCWATYSIIGKRLLARYDAFTITTYAFILGTLFYLPLTLPTLIPTIQHITVNGWTAILYLAVICSVFGYVAWYYALDKTEASQAAVFLNFIPVFTIIMSAILFEVPTVFFLAGAILIIYGVYLTQKN
jgi:drug/metabolite transporter (DMT)-like permease